MGLVSNFAVIGAVACTAVYAIARLLALLIGLRGTRPGQRAELVRAVAELFRRGRRNKDLRAPALPEAEIPRDPDTS